ncbi:uncharacterized protein LOC121497683 [Vulpes lagopus]|uniref:uncharacterized protein LOC121497683 n=1 Tax=Vulpes lagopus TaxID=494514 RepID=UPI001BC9534B|nr:uncharacterized protein LOC121497683 [Vulpes lagopus]
MSVGVDAIALLSLKLAFGYASRQFPPTPRRQPPATVLRGGVSGRRSSRPQRRPGCAGPGPGRERGLAKGSRSRSQMFRGGASPAVLGGRCCSVEAGVARSTEGDRCPAASTHPWGEPAREEGRSAGVTTLAAPAGAGPKLGCSKRSRLWRAEVWERDGGCCPPQHGAHDLPWASSDPTHTSASRLEIANQAWINGHQTQNPQENWKKFFRDDKGKGFLPELQGGQYNLTSALSSSARTERKRQIHQRSWDILIYK